jgi:hypothetical protein
MNTVKKGDAFESDVYKYIEKELLNDRLFVSGRLSKLFSKKGYYSRDRDTNIITDISIETYLPNAENYSLLTIIECKDYNRTIPVDDIEEFYSKVQQIAGVNVKAIFCTTSALQASALKFAESKKIGVMRFLPQNQIDYVIHTMLSFSTEDSDELNWNEFNSAFLNQNHRSNGRNFYACDDKYIYGSLFSILKEFINE